MLVGNKADLLTLRSVRTKDAKTFADRENIHLFMEVSALHSLNVDNAFTILLTRIYHAANKRGLNTENIRINEPKEQTTDYEREYYGIPGKLELSSASGSRYSQDIGSINELPRLSTKYLKLKDKMKKSSIAKELNWAKISSDDEDDHE
ncbi:hypothetical protein L1887_34511 [Cichorium endivia]|nr:hypothetical protein L1887_34511 [Cichorium endivia]